MVQMRVVISGKVQGVSYRMFVKKEAVKLGLRGYVKNRKDGGVEAVFEGGESEVKKMVGLCRKGSAHAVVEGVRAEEIENWVGEGFEVAG